MSNIKQPNLSGQLLELVKWLIGTIGLGLTGICINQEIQTTELKVKRLEADAKFLEVVTSDIGEDVVNSEIKYLEYILTFVTTPEIKKEVQEKINRKKALDIEEEAKRVKAKETEELDKIQNNLDTEQKEKFKEKRNQEESTETVEPANSIEDLVAEEENIAPNTEDLNFGESIIDSLQKATTRTEFVSNEREYKLVGTPVTKWVKKGYYVEFSERLRIGVKALKKNSITVNLKDIQDAQTDPILLKNSLTLSEGEIWIENRDDYRHQITLNYIGAAGKNPFTKAGYITVATYKKIAEN